MTHVIFGMIRELSAKFVAKTTLLIPDGAGSKTLLQLV
jgi:hypothetical protein